MANNFSEVEVNELDELKKRADQLGLKYHPNIAVDKLRIRVNSAINGTKDDSEEGVQVTEPAKPTAKFVPETEVDKRTRLRRDAEQLVRVNITCFDPLKKDWDGEVFTVSNSVIGTIKKFVAYNTSEGFHVPKIIVDMLKEKKYQHHYKVKENGKEIKRTKLISAYGIEVLPQLTVEELKELARRQALAEGQEV